MGSKTKEIGGGAAKPVATDWQNTLGRGLATGDYNSVGYQQMPRQITRDMMPKGGMWDSVFNKIQGQQQQMPYNMNPNVGGLGIGQAGQSPMQQTMTGMQQQSAGLGQLDQQAIAANPQAYEQWRQQAAQNGYNYDANGMQVMGPPNQVGGMQGFSQQGGGGIGGYINQQLGANPNSANYSNPNNPMPGPYTAPNQMQFDFSAINNPGASGLYGAANAGMMNLANMAAQGYNTDPYNGLNAPGGSTYKDFSSQGLLGDRSGVTNAITNAANTQLQDSRNATRARFTANGGMSFGTPAAYAEALTNARGAEGLASSLANSDLAYRNLDLGAYGAEQNAALGNRNIDSYIYGQQLGAANNRQNGQLAFLGQAGNLFQNVAGNEAGQQGIQFGYDQLGQQGQNDINQLNLQSGLGFGQLGLDAFRANSNNWAQQGGMDLQQRGMMSAQQQNLINQLFSAYGQSTGLGTPQAQMVQVPTFGQNVLDTAMGGIKMASGLGWQPFK